MAEKKYYWLKLQKDFFRSKRIKKLRTLKSGDVYTIIYLKMQLLSLDKGGLIEYAGLEDSFAKEVALDIDESAEDVQATINYLLECGLLETSNDISYLLPYAADNMGCNGESTERVRKFRESQKASYIDIDIDIDKEIEIEGNVTRNEDVTEGSVSCNVTCNKNVTLIDRFNEFWKAYPKKTGKGAALKSWQKIKPSKELFGKIMASLEEHKKCDQWRKDKGQFIPNPATWLNQCRWEDSVAVEVEEIIY